MGAISLPAEMKYGVREDAQEKHDQKSFHPPSLQAGALAWTRDIDMQNAECTLSKLNFGTTNALIQPFAVCCVPSSLNSRPHGPRAASNPRRSGSASQSPMAGELLPACPRTAAPDTLLQTHGEHGGCGTDNGAGLEHLIAKIRRAYNVIAHRTSTRAGALFGLTGGISVNVNAQPLITNVTKSVVNVLGHPATNPFAPGGEYICGTLYKWTH